MKFRIDLMKSANDGTRSLFESIMVPEVEHTLKKWTRLDIRSVLIGGLALSYHNIPRYTQDIDVLFLSKSDVPMKLNGFKKVRQHSFQCNDTHVEIELLDSDFLNISVDLVKEIFKTSIKKDGMLIASPSGLVALKLQRFSRQDQADIENLNKYHVIDLSYFTLTNDHIKKYESIINED
jgi:hypothetical protein